MLCYLFRHPDELSMGLSHLLLCSSPDSKAVYRRMYVILKGQGVGAGRKTFVFPEWIRAVLRRHFAHHVPDMNSTIVSVSELGRWRDPVADYGSLVRCHVYYRLSEMLLCTSICGVGFALLSAQLVRSRLNKLSSKLHFNISLLTLTNSFTYSR